MNKYEEELVKFCEKEINNEEYKNGDRDYRRNARSMVFGAILFSYKAGLIDMETENRIFDKYFL